MRIPRPILDNDEMGKDYDRDRIDKMTPEERDAATGLEAIKIAARWMEVNQGTTFVWHPDPKIAFVIYRWDESQRQVIG
jgi:hypothetical protein